MSSLYRRLQLLHFRLQLLHGLHGLVALVGQRPEDDFDEDGDKDDGDAVVVDPAVDQAQKLQHGPGHGGEETEINDLGERRLDGFQQGLLLGTDVHLQGLPGAVGKQRRADGHAERLVPTAADDDGVGLELAGNQGSGKIGIAKGGPRHRSLLNDGFAAFVRHGVDDFAAHVAARQDGSLAAAYVVLAGFEETGSPLHNQGIIGARRQALHRGAHLEVVPPVDKAIDPAHGNAAVQGDVERNISLRAVAGQHHVLTVAREDLAVQRNHQAAVRHDVGGQRHRGRPARRANLDRRGGVLKTRTVIVEPDRLHAGTAARQGDQRHAGINLDAPLLDFGIRRLDGLAWSSHGRRFLFGDANRFRRKRCIGRQGAGRGRIVKFGRGRRRRGEQDRPHDDHDQGQHDGQNGSFFHASVL